MNYLKLTNNKLDIGVINDLVADESCGAITTFAGTTRDNFEEKKVICLEYEAYKSMALKVMSNICDDVRLKWPDVKNIAIYHRLENVPVKEASVVIAISSPHRQSSLQSVQYAIDELKCKVPIWKKEQYDNSSSQWKANSEYYNDVEQPLQKRRKNVNFKDVNVIVDPVPSHLIQITASDNEIQRRIRKFIDRKREEINLNNILDYTKNNAANGHMNVDDSVSCARVDSVLIKNINSKTHLKVYRVENETGPHDPINYLQTLDKIMDNISGDKMESKFNNISKKTLPSGIAERIKVIEQFLNVENTPIPQSIYERIKAIEDKMEYLEAISPEYKHFMLMNSSIQNAQATSSKPKQTFTINDLDKCIDIVKNKIKSSNCRI